MNPMKNNSFGGSAFGFLKESNKPNTSRNFDTNSAFNVRNQNQPNTNNKQFVNQSTNPNQNHYGHNKQMVPSTKQTTLNLMPVPRTNNKFQPYPPRTPNNQNTSSIMNSTLNQTLGSSAQSVIGVGSKTGNVQMATNTVICVVEEKEVNNVKTVRFLTGNIEMVIKWNKMLQSAAFVHYEVIGRLYSIQEGTVRLQKIFLLRDVTGPVLKIVHFATDRISLPDFCLGIVIRCVGRMIGPNTLQTVCIREASADEISTLSRIYYVCDQEVTKVCQYK